MKSLTGTMHSSLPPQLLKWRNHCSRALKRHRANVTLRAVVTTFQWKRVRRGSGILSRSRRSFIRTSMQYRNSYIVLCGRSRPQSRGKRTMLISCEASKRKSTWNISIHIADHRSSAVQSLSSSRLLRSNMKIADTKRWRSSKIKVLKASKTALAQGNVIAREIAAISILNPGLRTQK